MTAPFAFEPGDRAGSAELEALAAGEALRPPRKPVTTGFSNLDMMFGGRFDFVTRERHFGGFFPGEVTVIGGDTGVNKTALCSDHALAASRFVPTTYFALEMGKQRITDRMLSALMRTEHNAFAALMRSNPEHPKVIEGLARLLNDHDLRIEERLESDPFTIAHVEAITRANGAKVVVIDYLEFLDGWNDGRDAFAENREILKRIRMLAIAQQCHVILPHQLTKNWRKGPKQRPRKSDLADASLLARMADAIVMLHRPFFGESEQKDKITELIVDKNRNGRVGITHLYRIGDQFRFEEMTSDEEADLECCAEPKRGSR